MAPSTGSFTTRNHASMTRRQKEIPAEAIVDLVSLLPWWAGVIIAVLSYPILHLVATGPLATNVPRGEAGALLVGLTWRAIAAIGQYLVPLACLAGAGVSGWRRHQRTKLIADVAQSEAT